MSLLLKRRHTLDAIARVTPDWPGRSHRRRVRGASTGMSMPTVLAVFRLIIDSNSVLGGQLVRAAADWIVSRLRDAARGRSAEFANGDYGGAVPNESIRDQIRGRRSDHRCACRRNQRDRRRPSNIQCTPHRAAGHTVGSMADHSRLKGIRPRYQSSVTVTGRMDARFACAASGHATAPPSVNTNSRRRM